MSSPFYEEGNYLCEIVEQGFTVAKTGTTQFYLKVKVLEDEYGEPVRQCYQRTIFRAITEKTAEYFIADLLQLGYTRDSFRFLDPNEPNHHSFVGERALFFCRHEQGQSGTQEKWGIARTGGGFTAKPPEDKAIRALDNLFGKQLRASVSASRATQPQPKAQQTAAQAVGDDDLPF